MVRQLLSNDGRRERMVRGREAFAAGDFYLAHELWEEAWNGVEGEARGWIQGLIQLATALYKLERGRADMALRLLDKALARLADAPELLDGVDVGAARKDGDRVRAAIVRGERPDPRGVRL